tara:strand:+ start:4621 stop:4845 length:225 start_codon:yes stop_codon:yes gene_type:complete
VSDYKTRTQHATGQRWNDDKQAITSTPGYRNGTVVCNKMSDFESSHLLPYFGFPVSYVPSASATNVAEAALEQL